MDLVCPTLVSSSGVFLSSSRLVDFPMCGGARNPSAPPPGGLVCSEQGTLTVRGIPGGNSLSDTDPVRACEVGTPLPAMVQPLVGLSEMSYKASPLGFFFSVTHHDTRILWIRSAREVVEYLCTVRVDRLALVIPLWAILSSLHP